MLGAETWAFLRAGGPFLVALIGVGLALGTCLTLRGFILFSEAPQAVDIVSKVHREARLFELGAFRRTVRTLTVACPLLGLLGTVSGMIRTFGGLAGRDASTTVAGGIAEALVTTEFGLALALFGLGFGRGLEWRELRLRRRLNPSPLRLPETDG